MILGRSSAKNDLEIIKEYLDFLDKYSAVTSSEVIEHLRAAPKNMCQRIGKSISEWKDNDILAILEKRYKSRTYYYGTFLSFLFLRGHRRASLRLLMSLIACIVVIFLNNLRVYVIYKFRVVFYRLNKF